MKKVIILFSIVFSAISFAGKTDLKAEDVGVALGVGYFVPVVKEGTTLKHGTFTFVKKGESCIAAFRRIGEKVTVAQCVAAAGRKGANTVVFWEGNVGKPDVYIVALQPGQKIGIVEAYTDGVMKKIPTIFPVEDYRSTLSYPLGSQQVGK
ncbi:MAG: hypothetical protein RI935_47 [Candidatus Parcubacteria bacterium]